MYGVLRWQRHIYLYSSLVSLQGVDKPVFSSDMLNRPPLGLAHHMAVLRPGIHGTHLQHTPEQVRVADFNTLHPVKKKNQSSFNSRKALQCAKILKKINRGDLVFGDNNIGLQWDGKRQTLQ